MPKGKELNETQRNLIVDLVNKGYSYRKIESQTGIKFTTVGKLMQKFKTYKTVKNIPGRGRKRKTTKAVDHKIVKLIEVDRFTSAANICEELEETYGVNLSPSTIRNRLHEKNFEGRTPCKKPFLSKRHRKMRYEWAQKYQNFPLASWKKFYLRMNPNLI